MKIQNTIFVAVLLILVAILLPMVLVMLSDISAVVVIDDEQIRIGMADTTILNLFSIILPILIVVGFIMKFMGSRDESSICKSCIWFLTNLTCEKNCELNCKECKNHEI